MLMTKKEEQLLDKFHNKLEKTTKEIEFGSKDYFAQERKWFHKYFGTIAKGKESKDIRDMRYNIAYYSYKFSVKDNTSLVSLKMERWCKEWEQYLKEDAAETAWLMEQISTGKLSKEDADKGFFTSPFDSNKYIEQPPIP